MNTPDDPSPIYSSPMDVATYRLLGLDKHAPQAINGNGRYDGLKSATGAFDDVYQPCDEAFPKSEVASGEVKSVKAWTSDKFYPSTFRDVRFYTTPGLAAGATDVTLMIFNDGRGYLGRNGPVRASFVLDSLFAAGEITDTLAIFVNPGRPASVPAQPETRAERDAADEQRSIEYDALRPEYAEFLMTEVIPLAEKTMACRVTSDPRRRLIGGISSGGIAAFTAAWFYPEKFGLVLSHCGSFTNIKGGHNYAYLVRTSAMKPLRIFMQSGENDIDGIFGNWPLANKTLAQSLAFAGYDYRFEFGQGGHTLAHGGALFADSLRWLLR